MINALFLIRSLDRGGAQRQIITLAKGLPKDRFAVTVITFYDGGALWSELQGAPGVRLLSLHKRGRWDTVAFLGRMWRTIKQERPQLIHGYEEFANLLGLVAGYLLGARVIWGIRGSDRDFARYDWAHHSLATLGAWYSRFADAIIANSHAGRGYHVVQGYADRRMVVIPNGIDTERFRPHPDAGRRVRHSWAIDEPTTLIGLVARLDPMKDHPTFLRAAALLAANYPDVYFVCIGDGPAHYAAALRQLADELALSSRLRWVGDQDEMPAIYSALDMATSSSAFGEGFSNALGEALACGIPVVATDVGDAAVIIRDARRIVPPRDPHALAASWADVLGLSPAERHARAVADRERILAEYSCAALVARTSAVFDRVL